MANFEVLSLDPTTPQIRAPGAGDGYSVPRDMTFATGTTLNAPTTVVSVNTSTDALRITQVGSGNALLVEDSANPDATPMVITATGNLGIGTTSPANALEIARGAGVAGGASLRGNGNSAAAEFFVGQGSGSDAFLYNRANATMIFGTNNATRMTLTAAGDLGIGTTSPASRLDVRNTGGTYDKGINLQTASAGNIGTFWTSATDLNIGIAGAHKFTNYDGSATRMTLDSSGNLGLGVTPSAWFSNSRVYQFGSGGALEGRTNESQYLALTANQYIDSAGAFKYIGSTFASRYQQYNGAHSWSTAASGTAGNAITFTQAMTLDASGRLGVGTTSPVSLIHGKGTANADVTYRFEPITNAYKSTLYVSSVGSGDGAIRYDSNLNQLGLISYSDLLFYVGTANISGSVGNERARITAAGNLGVGTSSPTEKLHVAGNVRISDCVQYTKTASNADLSTTITFNAGSSIYYPVAVEILVSRVNNAAPQGTSIILINARELNGTLSNQSSTTVSSAGDAVTVTLSVSGAALTITLDTDTGGVSKAVAFFKVISYNGVASIT